MPLSPMLRSATASKARARRPPNVVSAPPPPPHAAQPCLLPPVAGLSCGRQCTLHYPRRARARRSWWEGPHAATNGVSALTPTPTATRAPKQSVTARPTAHARTRPLVVARRPARAGRPPRGGGESDESWRRGSSSSQSARCKCVCHKGFTERGVDCAPGRASAPAHSNDTAAPAHSNVA